MEKINDRLWSWASILEAVTLEQAERTAQMPFVFPHVALMPDAHLGRGATVGSVIPTLGAIMPAAVGVDIGCGMIAVRTQLHVSELPADRSVVRKAVERSVPLSAGRDNRTIRETAEPRVAELTTLASMAPFRETHTVLPKCCSCSVKLWWQLIRSCSSTAAPVQSATHRTTRSIISSRLSKAKCCAHRSSRTYAQNSSVPSTR